MIVYPFTESASWASKPASRQDRTWRASIAGQRSSSHTMLAAITVGTDHRSRSSLVISSSALPDPARVYRLGAALGDQHDQPVQQEIGRPGHACRRAG